MRLGPPLRWPLPVSLPPPPPQTDLYLAKGPEAMLGRPGLVSRDAACDDSCELCGVYGDEYIPQAMTKAPDADIIFVFATDQDSLMPASLRAELEALLLNISSPYQVNLYSGVQHGFGVRANVSDPVQKFAKESAFLQAVRWFNNF